jgi:hypothetical protein
MSLALPLLKTGYGRYLEQIAKEDVRFRVAVICHEAVSARRTGDYSPQAELLRGGLLDDATYSGAMSMNGINLRDAGAIYFRRRCL